MILTMILEETFSFCFNIQLRAIRRNSGVLQCSAFRGRACVTALPTAEITGMNIAKQKVYFFKRYLSVYLSVCLSVCLSACLSAYIYLYLSMWMCMLKPNWIEDDGGGRKKEIQMPAFCCLWQHTLVRFNVQILLTSINTCNTKTSTVSVVVFWPTARIRIASDQWRVQTFHLGGVCMKWDWMQRELSGVLEGE